MQTEAQKAYMVEYLERKRVKQTEELVRQLVEVLNDTETSAEERATNLIETYNIKVSKIKVKVRDYPTDKPRVKQVVIDSENPPESANKPRVKATKPPKGVKTLSGKEVDAQAAAIIKKLVQDVKARNQNEALSGDTNE